MIQGPKCSFLQRSSSRNAHKDDEPIIALVNHHHQQRQKEKKKKDQTQSNKEKTTKKFLVSQVLDERKKKRNLQGHTTEVASSKSFYPRCPWEEPQRNSCNGKPWLLMKGFAWRRGGERLDREESQLFPRWKAKSPGGAAPWCVGHIKIFDRLQHYEKPPSFLFFLPPPTRHTPIRPPDWPVSLFGPREFKAGPLGAAQCALTPCNEISSCC